MFAGVKNPKKKKPTEFDAKLTERRNEVDRFQTGCGLQDVVGKLLPSAENILQIHNSHAGKR